MAQAAAKIFFVSLGCPKAPVDSERTLTRLRAEGFELAREHRGAEFLEIAQTESLEAIGNSLSENGRLIVTGCIRAEPEKIRARDPGVPAVCGGARRRLRSIRYRRGILSPPMSQSERDGSTRIA